MTATRPCATSPATIPGTCCRFTSPGDPYRPRRLLRAHAHRDQQHALPLWDSLRHGFPSLEVDVWVVDGEVLVGHDEVELDPARSLAALYLDPLLALCRAGAVPGTGMTLMVDLKTDGLSGYHAINRLLASYRPMLACSVAAKTLRRPVLVALSGSVRPGMLAGSSDRYASADGRLRDLGRGWGQGLMPLVSDDWARQFTWVGDGPMPATERTRLQRWSRQAAAEGRVLRFWGTPEAPGPARDAVWRELVAAGVGLVNTDDLCGLAAFLAIGQVSSLLSA